VKGDGKFQNIAAASVLAKTHRDDYMKKISAEFPAYGWEKNKGYPTSTHRAAIQKLGSTSHHRKSFQLLPRQLEMDFD
jgi:ribonuclease HII